MAELLPVVSSSQGEGECPWAIWADCLQKGAAAAKWWFVVSLYGDGLNNEAVKMCWSSLLNYYFSSPPELLRAVCPAILPSSFRKQEKHSLKPMLFGTNLTEVLGAPKGSTEPLVLLFPPVFARKIAFLPIKKKKKKAAQLNLHSSFCCDLR